MAEKRGKHSRREFLRYGGRIAGGAVVYGTIGNVAGRAYRFGRDLYQENVEPVVSKVGEIYNKGEEVANNVRDNFYQWFNIPKDSTSGQKETKKEVSRRSFFESILGIAHRHPVSAGTLMGSTYGGTKSAITGYGGHRTRKQLANLKDENIDLRNRVSDLEEAVKKIGDSFENKIVGNIFIVSGLFGVVFSLISASVNLTGFVVNNSSIQSNHVSSFFALFVSLIFLVVGIYMKEKNKQ